MRKRCRYHHSQPDQLRNCRLDVTLINRADAQMCCGLPKATVCESKRTNQVGSSTKSWALGLTALFFDPPSVNLVYLLEKAIPRLCRRALATNRSMILDLFGTDWATFLCGPWRFKEDRRLTREHGWKRVSQLMSMIEQVWTRYQCSRRRSIIPSCLTWFPWFCRSQPLAMSKY